MNEKELRARKEVDLLLKTGERKTIFINTWEDHVMNRDEILAFNTIINEKLYHVKPKDGEVFLPFFEYMGDHTENWIVAIDISTGKEFFRKNIKFVDMIDWKLSSSTTNLSKNGK